MPDVLEDGGPGRDPDAGADQDGDLVLEHVLGRSAVGSVDADLRHLLPGLERDLVHAHGVHLVVELGLGLACAEGVGEGAGEVADLADVDGDVRVEGAGCDGEGVPLVFGDGGAVDEEPLAGLVLHRRFAELDLDGVWLGLSEGARSSKESLAGARKKKTYCKDDAQPSQSASPLLALTSLHNLSIKYKPPPNNSHRHPSYPMQWFQKFFPANGENGAAVSRTKQPVAWVYMPSKNGMNRWWVYQNVSYDCWRILWWAVVYMSNMHQPT